MKDNEAIACGRQENTFRVSPYYHLAFDLFPFLP